MVEDLADRLEKLAHQSRGLTMALLGLERQIGGDPFLDGVIWLFDRFNEDLNELSKEVSASPQKGTKK